MNYIMEINLFYDRLEVCAIPPTAISLWFAMMHIANKSGWPQEISIPISTLEARAHLERRGVYRAREILRTEGLIDFRERGGNQCAVYRLISLEGLLYKNGTQSVTQPPSEIAPCCTDSTHKTSHSEGLLYENDTQCVTIR